MERWILGDRSGLDGEPARAEAGLLGGKAFNLLRLRAQGFPVPAFLVVSSEAFEAVVGCDPMVRGLRARLDAAGPRELAELSARLQERALALGPPPELTRRLRTALRWHAPERQRWAVRSSALGEESERRSFAGLLDWRLNVGARDLGEAVAAVWASVFSARCLVCRRRQGSSLRELSTAVIVQRMVDAAASGVLFTVEPDPPADGAPRALLLAGWGLGEGVVRASVGSDTVRVGRSDDSVETSAGEKRRAIVTAPAGGTRRLSLPESAQREAVLSDAQVLHVRDLGLGVERALAGTQDVEWAFDARGGLHLLQARPILRAAGQRDDLPRAGRWRHLPSVLG